MNIYHPISKSLVRPVHRSLSVPAAMLGGDSDPLLAAPGALAVWPMDEGSGSIAKNVLQSSRVDNNLWHAPEVGFNHQTAKGGSATATDAYAAGNDGRTRAVRIVFPGSASVTLNNFACSSGVAHTLSFKYKRTGASDQTFKAYADALSGELTATDTWQTYSVTWTPSTTTPTIGVYSHGATAADFLICDFKVEQGSSSTPYVAPQSHVVFVGNNKPTWSSAGITTANNSRAAYATRNVDATLSAFTAYHCFKQTGSVEANYNTIQHLDITVNKWFMGPGGTAGYSDFRANNGTLQFARATKPTDGMWHTLCAVYNGTYIHYYLDGVICRTHTLTGTTAASYIRFFSLFTGGFGAIGSHGYAAWYDAAHGATNVVACTEAIRKIMVNRGETFNAITNLIVCEGDSIFEGIAYAGLIPVPERIVSTLPANSFVANIAKSGSSVNSSASPGAYTTSLYARRATIDYALSHASTNKILCVSAGTNDMNGGIAATFLANLKAYCLERRNAGWKVVVGTCLPSTYSAGGFNAKRATANAEIKNAANIGVYWDAVADQGGDTTCGKDGDELNATYYPDTVHPSNAACVLLEPYWTAAISSLI